MEINSYYVEGTKADLVKASSMIKKIRDSIKEDVPIGDMKVGDKLNYKIKTEVILYAIADMTIPLTKKHDSMQKEYRAKYGTKKEAQKHFLKDYYALHKPYDRIKSACWKTLYLLDG